MRPGGRIRPGVSLVCTMFNEADGIVEFLESVFRMDVLPGEFVIVDGGSDDGTNEAIAAFFRDNETAVKVVHTIDPTCSRKRSPGPIARGRNVAISAASGEIIAVTDAGCRLDPEWLGRIVAPLLDSPGVNVAGGWYLADSRSGFEECAGMVFLVPPDGVDPGSFQPSSRSLAFRKSVWSAVGGYPEHTLLAEDTLFNIALRTAGYRIVFVPDAIVYWRMKDTVGRFWQLMVNYGYGDGSNAILLSNLLKVVVKLSAAGFLLALSVIAHPAFLAVLIGFWAGLVMRYRRGPSQWKDALKRLPCLVGLKVLSDMAYLTGYLRGALKSGPLGSGSAGRGARG